ncbi:hypothetical protein [Polaromonas sp. CG_9.11]|uniref:hypothetical protein n=1 Tax=Polaromonas sp. CG_9.11 TaxID=2787730 RepID=UPI0018CB55B0|nr:hypothetical protein [Polaromonas sp. CG_9.11]MBG6076734.1 hypothetical protein [Polaromonas sp. CG_9.11]
MKTFLVLCAVAGLSGCAVYPSPGYETYGYDVPAPQVIRQPVYIYGGGGGGTVYRSDGFGNAYPQGYYRPLPPPVVVVPGPRPERPLVHGPRPGRGQGDRDGDGIPNRFDRDRDGDGIRNRLDRHPNHSSAPNRVERSRSRDRDGDGLSDRIDPRPDIPNRR